MVKQEKWYITVLKTHSLSLALLLVSTLITVLNTYAFIKLAPIVQNLDRISIKVEAIEQNQGQIGTNDKRLVAVEENIVNIKEDIAFIKSLLLR